MTILFRSAIHKRRFLAAIQQIGKVYDGWIDQEYGAALYVLTADTSTWERTKQHVHSDHISFQGILESGYWSGGETVLLQWASNLFNGHDAIGPVELMRLDENNFQVAITALQIRRDRLKISDIS